MAEKLSEGGSVSSVEKEQHIEDVKTKCPFCGGELVLRKGRYGEFYGYSNYPKCKFTKKA